MFLRTESFGQFIRLYPIITIIIAIHIAIYLAMQLPCSSRIIGFSNHWQA